MILLIRHNLKYQKLDRKFESVAFNECQSVNLFQTLDLCPKTGKIWNFCGT